MRDEETTPMEVLLFDKLLVRTVPIRLRIK